MAPEICGFPVNQHFHGSSGLPGTGDELKTVVKSFVYMMLENCKVISERVGVCF